MKNLIKLILIIIICSLFSCKGEDASTILSTSSANISVDYLGGISTITVTTTASSFTCNSSKDWCKVDINENTITATITENTTESIRAANIRVTANDKNVNINVLQGVVSTTLLDSIALLKVKALNSSITWTTTMAMDTWDGVKISKVGDSRRVIELDLHDKNLSGSIPVEIKSLTELSYLDLSNNTLSGTIPDMSTLTNLVVLDLSINKLTGTLPEYLSTIKSLAYLSIGQNKLTGTLSSEYGALTSLNVLDLGLNQFTGSIPSSWSTLSKLRYLYLYGNSLEGTIPSYISSFSKLINLSVEYNNLTGNIPTGIGSISTLTNLTMSRNRLSGTVPSDLVGNSHWNIWKTEILNQQTFYILTEPYLITSMLDIHKMKSTNETILLQHVLPDKRMFVN
jgi:Leucine-rich repeat (LRR) protein